jgi:lysophospholipase L1-like esterase
MFQERTKILGSPGRLRLLTCVVSFCLFGKAFADELQAGFHQALRWSYTTVGRQTFRTKLPMGRSGSQVRLCFKSGSGPLTLYQATIAQAGTGGALASSPVAVTFSGQAGFSTGSNHEVASDSVAFPVSFGDEVYVSLDVEGSLAESAIMGFPDSFTWPGSEATTISPANGTQFPQAIGLASIEVLAARRANFVAIGDSITEGYVDGDVGTFAGRSDNYRHAWTTVAQVQLGLPLNNAAVSGQGTEDATNHLPTEVFTLHDVDACLVLIGTNDLGAETQAQIESDLTVLVQSLKPFCSVYLCTLLPKQSTTEDFTAINAERQAVNAWIRAQNLSAGTIDTESAVAAPGNPDAWQPGLTSDGIHPSIQGDAVLGSFVAQAVADFAAEAALDAGAPTIRTGPHVDLPSGGGAMHGLAESSSSSGSPSNATAPTGAPLAPAPHDSRLACASADGAAIQAPIALFMAFLVGRRTRNRGTPTSG